MNKIFQSRKINHEEEPIPQRNKDAESNSLIPGPSHICHPKKEPFVNTSLMKTLGQNNITFLRALSVSKSGVNTAECLCPGEPNVSTSQPPFSRTLGSEDTGASADVPDVPGEGVRRSVLSFCRNVDILLPNSLKNRREKSCLYFHDAFPVFTFLMGIHC